ncbi:MAG TPA: DUF2844 domain-containing protein [Paraburkholderia sp.]|uniref:DUF2844 domain-containing protein n=1 Tax=Paraburkholderia sp. TaxID=1926495 RepID=UPI002BD019DC|nr:DUF2844 domain-containing protein [Paraburkholderia sp.]HTR06996.1 DUF2844 domain-containing protein [Paraburkholderia sp.]
MQAHNIVIRGVFVAASIAMSSAAHASLGGLHQSVALDQSQMHANRQTTTGQLFTTERLTLENGAHVTEYVNRDDVVFAVTWHGPAMPDLQQLLGSYAQRAYDGAKAFRAAHSAIGPVVVSASDLVVQTGGHMRAYWGRAWLPNAVPASLNVQDIQ